MPDLNEDEPQPYTPRGGPAALAETDDRLMWLLTKAGDEWGPLGVALTAALMSDPDAVVGSLVSAGSARRPEPDGPYAYLLDDDTLDRLPRIRRTSDAREALDLREADRARPDQNVAGLYATIDDLRQQLTGTRADLVRHRDERNAARRQLVEQGEAAEEQADALRSEVARLSGLLDEEVPRRARAELNFAAQQQTTDTLRGLLDGERARAERAEGLVDESVPLPPPASPSPPREVPMPGGGGETSPHPIADDPRRPHLDSYPEDAILLTYRELRQLVGLHLEACATSVAPSDSARAMRDGETGLRLAEVLDR